MLKQLQEKAVSHENELLRTLRELPANEHEYATLEAPADFSLGRLQTALPADTTLVEYYSTGERLLAAVVTSKGINIVPVSVVSRVLHFLHLLRFQLSKFRMGAAYAHRFEQPLLQATQGHLETLYAELIAPLQGHIRTKHLVFVPHGALPVCFPIQSYLLAPARRQTCCASTGRPAASSTSLHTGRTGKTTRCSRVFGSEMDT